MSWTIPNTGTDIQLQFGATAFQYRYLGTSSWLDIAPIEDLAGEPANGTTTQALTIPSVNSTVDVTVDRTTFVVIGSNVIVRGLDTGVSKLFNGEITNIDSITKTLTIKALGYSGDDTGTLETGAVIVASGQRGATGAAIDEAIVPLLIESAQVKDYILIRSIPWTATIDNIVQVLTSGSLTFSLKINTNSVTGISSVTASSVETTNTATAANLLSAGDDLILSVSAVSSPIDFSGTIKLSSIG